MYLPQFHITKENDEWWGKGFTDWVNVKNAEPLYLGHRQPRVPLDDNYYDLSKPEAIHWQADLANAYSVYGFNIYHYWFDGKLILNIPKEILLRNADINLRFSLIWANERWTTRWDGAQEKVLMEQTHEPSIEKWEEHFMYLLPFFQDARYIKVENKPIFTVYRPHLVKKLEEMIRYWQRRAKECGLEGVYMIAAKSYEYPDPSILDSFDACMYFQPAEAINSPAYLGKGATARKLLRRLPEGVLNWMRKLNKSARTAYKTYDYDAICKCIVESEDEYLNKPVLPSLFLEWDNTARYKQRAAIYQGCTPERFEYWLDRLCRKVSATPGKERIIFINAWNEWAEGTYLEPDTVTGYRYLEAIERCVSRYSVE